MIEQKVSEMNKWFDEKIAACRQRDRELTADDRQDEAVFEKVKGNIYDNYRTMLGAGVRIGRGDPAAVKQFFIGWTETIPASWKAAYEKAKEHDDLARMQIEQVKLDVVHEIREQFEKVWEGAE